MGHQSQRTFLLQVERCPVINTCIICFSNFLECLARPFDVSLAAAGIQPHLCEGGKIRFAEPQAVLSYWCRNAIWIVDCRLLLCRVGKQSFSLGVFRSWSNPSQGADRIHVARTRIRKVLIVGKELFSLVLLIKVLIYHHTQREGFGLSSEITQTFILNYCKNSLTGAPAAEWMYFHITHRAEMNYLW